MELRQKEPVHVPAPHVEPELALPGVELGVLLG